MAILWTHLITWIVMAITICMALFTNSHNKVYEMITRVGYIVIIVTGILMFGNAWKVEPTLLIVKIILVLIFIALTEIAFARKNTGMLSTQLIWAVVVFCIVVALVGFALSGWYPFVTK
ncbi:DUF1516 family protein [Companilactobacillus ginsenosidimutans]|uniref:Uncharacterized protein n=1 Tax=Companilactobacillus ginsenosidimutans TaxID=1007676 RepID=A0A0H4R0W3_9LACO|nr:DUF1516 family protein [Companilactobacillus ginsenosidimutans]AKP67365.1 hypothetical protein ABM34_07320 [Companilactobacillus ginsenosidimutans]